VPVTFLLLSVFQCQAHSKIEIKETNYGQRQDESSGVGLNRYMRDFNTAIKKTAERK
jgi:hypothetical protein